MKIAAAIVLCALLSCAASAAELKPATLKAFDRYVAATEARIAREVGSGPFLWVDTLPAQRRTDAVKRMRAGEVVMERLESRENGREIEVPDGMVHHWVGSAFIPNTTVAKVLRPMQDYGRHSKLYYPEVVDSKLLDSKGDFFRAFLRFRKKKIITVEMNTTHDIWYYRLDAKRVHTKSIATRIAEIEEPGTPKEREKPAGEDTGFLWRLNSFWRLEERDGGVYIQCEAVSLTRDIPFGTGWVVKPFVTSVPRESLEATLNLTRRAVQSEATAKAATR